ncbi:uncharacterized protein LOC111115244 [Crassostrea virginica]
MIAAGWRFWTLVVCFCVQGYNDVQSLECWKCIQKDCHVEPSTNQRAEKVQCAPGQHCLKVRYQMFHNDSNTHYDSVIRTCSSSKCSNMAEDEYNRCLLHPRDYWFQGCSLRSCCKDRDLCNAESAPWIHHYLIYTTITMQILLLVT